MGGVAVGTEIRVVRRDDDGAAGGRKKAVELADGANHVGDVLDDVSRAYLAERVAAEGVRKVVEIGNDVRAGMGIPVHTDRAAILV